LDADQLLMWLEGEEPEKRDTHNPSTKTLQLVNIRRNFSLNLCQNVPLLNPFDYTERKGN